LTLTAVHPVPVWPDNDLPKLYENVKQFLRHERPDAKTYLLDRGEMIAYDLICSNGHIFECWFRDSASYEEQKSSCIINCPVCNDSDLEKVFSPFAIRKKEEKKEEERKKEKVDPDNPYRALRLIQEHLDKHFEDVGTDFTKEALKIHYGEAEKRNIKGTATTEEEIILKEEGVPFLKIPIIKRLMN
jgi:hypothetical protein